MNTAYKHLDARLRIAELSIPQWIGVLLGVGTGILWGVYLSPLGSSATLVTAIYIGAVPAGAAVLASATEFDLWLLVRSAFAWHRLEGCFVRGPGDEARGYAVRESAQELALERHRIAVPELDLESLWEES